MRRLLRLASTRRWMRQAWEERPRGRVVDVVASGGESLTAAAFPLRSLDSDSEMATDSGLAEGAVQGLAPLRPSP